MIAFKKIKKTYGSGNFSREILGNIDVSIPEKSFTTFFGPNGCGKSTLMNLLAGLDAPTEGIIEGIAPSRSNIGFVFQDYRRSLLPWLTVEENILFPLRLRHIPFQERQEKLDRVISLTNFQIDLQQRVFTLSGGQAQMVCLLRALIINPKLLILDEPFSALDYERTLFLRQKITEIAKTFELTVLFISHDLEEALYLGDQVVFLSKPPTRIQAILPVPFSRPRNPELIASPDFSALKLEALKIFQKSINNGEL